MASTKVARNTARLGAPEVPGKIYMENTLLRLSGALFCHDAKRAPTRTQEIVLNRGVPEKATSIRPDPRLGQPGPLAHKVFVALIKKHSDYGRPIPPEVTFTRREIGRLLGRRDWGGRDSEQLSRALHEIHYTFIKAHFKDGATGRHVEHSFNIFPEIRIERREFASDPIEACTVTLAAPIVASLADEHFTCLNHALLQRLGTIGQALYMRLFFHFANLYDGRNGKRLALIKRYDDLCTEWLGGLTVLEHKSKIVGEQLGAHLAQLVDTEFLAGYAIDRAKTREGFVLTFRPGRLFFDDYARFYRNREQGELQFDFHGERRQTADPLRLAYLFAERRTGQPVRSIAFVPTKDVETAKQLLAELPFTDMPAFIDYALGEAARTNFDVQTLGGVKQYLAGYMALRKRREATRAQEAAFRAQEQADADRRAYEAHRAAEGRRLFAALPAADRDAIEAEATRMFPGFTGSLAERMTGHQIARITAERHAAKIIGFDDWNAARRAA